ncbi:MAG: TadE/TadG family type IV pilus assembly protein [Armatimonadota bacterium]
MFTTERPALERLAQSRSDGTIPRRGSVTVELAMVVPLLVFLLFAILEFGLLVQRRSELGQAAREGTRQAAVGATPTRIAAEVASVTGTLDPALLTQSYTFRVWNAATSTWGPWQTLGVNDTGTENNASSGNQVRVRLEYRHRLLLPGLMGQVMHADEDGYLTVVAATVMMRE